MVKALITSASQSTLCSEWTTTMWFGLSLLGLCVGTNPARLKAPTVVYRTRSSPGVNEGRRRMTIEHSSAEKRPTIKDTPSKSRSGLGRSRKFGSDAPWGTEPYWVTTSSSVSSLGGSRRPPAMLRNDNCLKLRRLGPSHWGIAPIAMPDRSRDPPDGRRRYRLYKASLISSRCVAGHLFGHRSLGGPIELTDWIQHCEGVV